MTDCYRKKPVEVRAWKISFDGQEPDWVREAFDGERIDLEKVFVAAILAAKRFAVTEEERVAILRYAHGCASPEETQIVLRLVTERKTKICPKQSN